MLTQRKTPRLWFVLASIFILTFVSACGGNGGGGDQPIAEGPDDDPGATSFSEGIGEGAAGPTATVPKINAPTAVTHGRPTGVAQIRCQEGQRELVWLVRNDPVANPWEQDVVRPAFQQANPEICLNIISVNQDDIAVRRATMIASGQPLHVWSPNWGGNGYASDRAQGLLENMTPLIEQDNFDTSMFIPEVLEIYKVEGGTYGLPFLTTGSYVYYNQELLEEAGLEPPPTDWNDKSWTWDKMMQYAKKLTKNTENVNRAQYGLQTAVLNIEGPPMMWGQFVWPEGAYETGYAQEGIDVTNEASVKAFQAFHDSIYKDKVAPDPATTAALDQLGGAFASGKVAMAMSGGWGHWVWKGLIDDPNGFCWGAAPMPWGSPNADKRTVIYTDPWSITSNLGEQERADAWTFVKFLVSEEQARKFTEVTGTPPTQPKLLAEYYQQFEKCMEPEKMKEVFEGAFEHGYESSNHLIVNWDELNQIWANALDPYFANRNANTEQMLQTIETQTNEALTRIYEEREQQ